MIIVFGLEAFLPQLKGLVRDIRPVWTLEELGLPYQRKVMKAPEGEHKRPEYLAVNPFGKVPAIQDGDLCLFESAAICTYLGDKKAKLLPAPGTPARAIYDQWTSFVISTLEPMAVRVVGIDFFVQDKDASLLKYREDALKSVDAMVAVLDQQLSTREYLLGESFSIADIMLSSVLRLVSHTEITTKHLHVQAYLDRNFARPAFLKAIENNG